MKEWTQKELTWFKAYPKILSEAPEKSGVEAFARIFPVPFRNFGICSWYACYGSNILFERFRLYIEGGDYPVNGRHYRGCADKTLPRKTKPVVIPYELYFGNRSSSWNGCGVAFLDDSKTYVTIGRMYLITSEQFEEVRMQEGSHWYDKTALLGKESGYPTYTFTHSSRYPENAPSQIYLDVMAKGMKELVKGIVVPQMPN